MALYARELALLFKLETVYGTDPTPTGAANAILASEVTIQPMEGEDVSRNLEQPYMGGQGTIPVGLHSKITFKLEAKGSGEAGTPPVVGPLLRSCACAEVIVPDTSVTYNRVTKDHASATIYLHWGGILYKILGARGNVIYRKTAQGITYWEFEFMGLFTQPEDQAVPAAVVAAQLTHMPVVATTATVPVFAIGDFDPVVRSFALNFGVTPEYRGLIRSESVIIPDFQETIEMTIEAVPLATWNPYALAQSGALAELEVVQGTGAGNIITIAAPQIQIQRPASIERQQGLLEWPLRAMPLPETGNDQFTIAFT